MYRLQVLGPVELTREDGSVVRSVLSQPKRLALLTYLALARPRGFHRRDHLVTLFWPEKDDSHARGSLSQSLSFLRRSLGDGLVRSRGDDSVAIDPGRVIVDALEFEARIEAGDACGAVERYRGPLLAGFHVPEAPDFDLWVEQERTRLRHLAWKAAREASIHSVEADNLPEAVALARRAVAIHPHNDVSARELMTLLNRIGDRAGALEVFRELSYRLREDLEADPERETLDLEEAIRAGMDGESGVVERPSSDPGEDAPSLSGSPLPQVIETRASKDRSRARWLSSFAPWAVTAVVAVLWLSTQSRPQAAPWESDVSRLSIPLPEGQRVPPAIEGGGLNPRPIALSRDGSTLAYVALTDSGRYVFVRDLDSFESRALPGTRGAEGPFFSPDGEWIGFFADGMLRRIPSEGGPARTIAPAGIATAVWTPDDSIVIGGWGGLRIVAASGGEARPLTRVTPGSHEVLHYGPELLPQHDAVLFDVWSWPDAHAAALVSLQDGSVRTVLADAFMPQYLPTGHLLFERGGYLQAQPVDVARGAVRGSPAPLLQAFKSFIAVSPSRLVYLPPVVDLASRRFVWVDRQGNETPLAELPGTVFEPHLTHDGRRLTFLMVTDDGPGMYVLDLDSGRLRLVHKGGSWPVPSPDGRWLAFADVDRVLRVGMDVAGDTVELFPAHAPVELYESSSTLVDPTSWIGRTLVIHAGRSLWAMDADGDGEARVLVPVGWAGRLSPDGDWLAYESDESGQGEVYVKSISGEGVPLVVSVDGGADPLWSADNREMFYRRGSDEVWSVSVSIVNGKVTLGEPHRLLAKPYPLRAEPSYAYHAASDRFIMLPADTLTPAELRVWSGWQAELQGRSRER